MVQIEHVEAVADLDAIVSVDGVDGFIIGPYDLSASVGKPGAFDDPEVAGLFDSVSEAIQRSAKPAGVHIVHPDLEALLRRIEEGFRFIAYGDDMVFYNAVVNEVAGHVRGVRP